MRTEFDESPIEYRCRRCGRLHESEPVICGKRPDKEIARHVCNEKPLGVHKRLIHRCADGGVGISELVGCGPPDRKAAIEVDP